MTRILGHLLGLSLQTELLIMTLLGLANSTLNWKPFDLGLKLDSISNLNFLKNGIQFSYTFTTWTKLVLRLTVVLEFFCSLVLPFVYLLRLYPIITWSRSYILLPWLVTHALNTILPKILSIALAFVFHREGIVSRMSFLEFLAVESINLAIAVYNWYMFFSFYEDLRKIERKRKLHKIYLEALESGGHLRPTYSSIPDINQALRDSSADDLNVKELRVSKSLTLNISTLGNGSQDLESEETSPPSGSIEEVILHAEKTELSQDLTLKRSEDPHELVDRANHYHPKVEAIVKDQRMDKMPFTQGLDKTSDPSKKSDKAIDVGCVCTSSEEDVEVKLLVSERIRSKPPATNEELDSYILQSVLELESKRKARSGSKKTNNQSMQTIAKTDWMPSPNALLFLPNASIALNQRDRKFNEANPFVREDLKFLDSFHRTMDMKRQTAIPRDRKWLIFHSELESNLKGDVFLKELISDTSLDERNIKKIKRMERHRNEEEFEFWNKDDLSKMSEFSESKWSRVQNMIDHSMGRMKGAILLQNSGDEMRLWNVQKKMSNPSKSDFSGSSEISKSTISSQAGKESSGTSHSSTKNSMPYARLPKYRKSNISVLKSIKPSKWSQYMESQEDRQLRNLRKYNDLCCDQDSQDGPQKRKRSKLTNYKNIVNELSLFNSDVTMTRKDSTIIQDRGCKSTGVQKVHLDRSHRHQLAKASRLGSDNDGLRKEDERTRIVLSPKVIESHDQGLDHLFERELTNYDNNARFESPMIKPNQRDAQIPGSSIYLGSKDSSSIKLECEQSAEVDVPRHRASLREAIKRLNWSCHESPVETTSLVVTNFDGMGEMTESQTTRESRNLVDDETMSLLRNAFSHSDETDRGFCLGVEAGEPYPVFQTLALTVAEIYKAVSLSQEPATDQLSTSDDVNGVELQLEDSIVCGCNNPDVQDTAVDPTPPEEVEDDIEKRKSASAELLDQLQQLLDSSRRTLSALEIVRGEVRIAEAQLFAGSASDCIDAFKELYERGERMKAGAPQFRASDSLGDSSKTASTLEGACVDSNVERQRPVRCGADENTSRGNVQREKAGGSGEGRRKSKTKVFETIFENKMQMHQVRRGEGLSSGNVMEFDSEGQVLSRMESQNPSLVVQPTSGAVKKERHRSEENLRSHGVAVTHIAGSLQNRDGFGDASNPSSKLCPCREDTQSSSYDVQVSMARDLEKSTTTNYHELISQKSDGGERPSLERDKAKSARDDHKSRTRSNHQSETPLFSKFEVELKSSDLSNSETGGKFQDLVQCNNEKQDKHTNRREVASSTKINIPTIIGLPGSENENAEFRDHQQLLEDHRRMLESDSIKETVRNWASSSMESMYSIDHRDYRNPTPPPQVSFSDVSDLEEFEQAAPTVK